MYENFPPTVADAVKTIAMLQLLTDPVGLRRIKDELKALTDGAIAAHKQLGKRQREIAAAEAALKDGEAKHNRTVAELESHGQKVAAASEALDRRTERLATERAQHREEKAAVGRDQAAHRLRMAELDAREEALQARETEADRKMAAAEKLSADFERRHKALNTALAGAV